MSQEEEGSPRHTPVLDQLRRPAKREQHEDEIPVHEAAEESGKMSRAEVNFWLDALLLVLFVALGATAVIVQFIFPPGVAAKGWLLWGMT